MENNTDMRQYLDPKFIYTASIRVSSGGGHKFRKAYAVNKDMLRRYAKWVDADRFTLTETFELSDGCLSSEALQLDSCESLTKQGLREYLGKECKFMPGELAIAKDDNKYAITTNGWQGVVLAVIRRPDTNDPDLVVQDVNGSDIPYIVEQSAFRTPDDTEKPLKNMFAEFDKLSSLQKEEILKTIGLKHWAKDNGLEFTYADAGKCIAVCYGDDDYIHIEYGDVYSEDGDMTFIMRYDYDHLDGTINTNVTGFYHGRPNEDDDRIYKETVVAKSEEE
jgi:hypothetical protein